MNRKEFQKWLDQFPEDTQIEVVMCDNNTARTTTFKDRRYDYWDYSDLSGAIGNDTTHPRYNKPRYLELGSE